MALTTRNKEIIYLIIAAVIIISVIVWITHRNNSAGDIFIQGNGRIEATEIDVATKLAGRVNNVLVNEGDFVKAGDLLADMQIQVLEAQKAEAIAQHQQSINNEANSRAQIVLQESNKIAAQAVVIQYESDLDAAQRRLNRTEALAKRGALSQQELDDDRAKVNSAKAAVASAKAQVAAAEAAIDAAKAQSIGAASAVKAAEASIARVEADINDSKLTAPRDGRIQFKIAQPGEVLSAGGKVLNMLDLSDVYMTFFLPETAAGKLAIGSEARIILDAAPQYVIPAYISFVSSAAQFTPKTVETQNERQKLMFKVKAQIDRDLLLKYLPYVKTGLPGVAWVKLDANAAWPDKLMVKIEPAKKGKK